ncbi:MAG: DUF89 family protein [Planctomycetes bacterium]|nr:DUF89 family protein [Planctomycetota bacterium]
MQTYLDCVPCFASQALDAVRMVTDDDELRWEIISRVLETASHFTPEMPPPAMGTKIHRIIREETGNPDPYREIKKQANCFGLEKLPDLRGKVRQSDDPFEAALRLAIAGNIMDWGAKPHTDLSEEMVDKTLEECLTMPLPSGAVKLLQKRIEEAQDILYLADNAGEIVLDRLFLEFVPSEKITVAVKGSPAINDATMEDARQIELDKLVRVIDTGSDTPGTLLDECSEEFREVFAAADLIVAKGQGNYEALSEESAEIVFLLKAKCPVVARDIGCEIGDMVIVHHGG